MCLRFHKFFIENLRDLCKIELERCSFLGSMLPQYMALFTRVCVCQKKYEATSKQGRRLRFGMLTVVTNIRTTKVLHHVSCIKHNALQVGS